MCLVIFEKELWTQLWSSNFQNATLEKNYHNSDGSCSHSSVISYRSYGSTVLNKNNNNEHGEYYGIFISFKVQISQNNVKSVQYEFFLVFIFMYSDQIQENTDQKKLHNWTLFTQRQNKGTKVLSAFNLCMKMLNELCASKGV